ncbi:hypothetical protein R1flu_023448 [Riccia fluitans]|uniref:Uncharacterized protein n=1 Tax=Riccia fluitans TaxID=41844 RepID=A0ABD1XV34_9MARC
MSSAPVQRKRYREKNPKRLGVGEGKLVDKTLFHPSRCDGNLPSQVTTLKKAHGNSRPQRSLRKNEEKNRRNSSRFAAFGRHSGAISKQFLRREPVSNHEMTNLSLSVLYHGTFKHNLPGDHVDEIRFDETVTISAIEITDFRAREDYKSLSSDDGTTGSGLPVDIFFRVEGAECFKRLSNPFRFYPSAPPLYDQDAEASEDDYGSYWSVEETETDHIVLRGTHDYLTLIVYGN